MERDLSKKDGLADLFLGKASPEGFSTLYYAVVNGHSPNAIARAFLDVKWNGDYMEEKSSTATVVDSIFPELRSEISGRSMFKTELIPIMHKVLSGQQGDTPLLKAIVSMAASAYYKEGGQDHLASSFFEKAGENLDKSESFLKGDVLRLFAML